MRASGGEGGILEREGFRDFLWKSALSPLPSESASSIPLLIPGL